MDAVSAKQTVTNLLCNRAIFSLTLIIDMKRKGIYENDSKSKKPSLGEIHGPGVASSTSTSTTDLMPSIHVNEATASAQVTAALSVSIQLRSSHL